jgi:DNA-binding LacI/PurR family transcriptional regulator
VSARIEDVARQAGVSTATVSRVLSGKPYVSAAVRQRVLDAIGDLNYHPSRVARSLRVQRSSIIGLIISDIQNPFFTSVVRAVEDVAQQRGYSVILCNSDEDVEKELTYIELMLAEQVSGMIVSPTASSNAVYRRLVESHIPVVAIDRRVEGVPMDMVVGDNVKAACAVVSHLIENGYRRIGAVLGTPDASTGAERYQGYVEALAAHELPSLPELVRSGPPRSQNGYELTVALLAQTPPPDAIFTGNNLLTIGALRAIYERGLRIPDDIAVAGFDEMDWMFLVKPALTVVMQPTYEMGQRAAELLLERIANPERPPQAVVLQPAIKVRESSRRVAVHARISPERG